jgi:adenylate cyclase class 2
MKNIHDSVSPPRSTVYEVELKFRLIDPAALEGRLTALGARFSESIAQVDRYFAHPARDFATTDEALRLRRVGDDVAITWKGPQLAGGTKTRREIELPLEAIAEGGPGGQPVTLDRWTELLEALSFRRVLEVAKRRRPGRVAWDGDDIELALDAVIDLGDFLELELLATPEQVPAAQARLESLARAIGCGAPEPRSYLELLLLERM